MIMVTEKQHTANKKNAKKGGVRTTTGKLVSRYNARKHGLFSKEVLLPWEDSRVIARLRRDIVADLKPQGEVEYQLVMVIVYHFWKQQRGARAEKSIMEQNHKNSIDHSRQFHKNDPLGTADASLLGAPGNNNLELVARYEAKTERQLSRALQEFRQHRLFRQAEEKREAAIVEQDSSQAK